ncbi:hypothetical protein HRG_000820 [Hirsutella rhossiliensis]|uniref:Cytidyltransferase-like domain-containing protein n=1 Tax=Hirsutella rhossiliensis TaxID=111463 RepID=A0A9P8SM41_9HYPO|nr:uncharacterized protein HRG_00820 [Hirsutella rhossiliensis]KAH0968178.1 hypothetical protein HRG_00820 [Hirsutella rhossiliensis]
MAQSRRLGDFVATVAAEQGLELNPSHPPFNHHDSPILRPNRAPNHVLLYPGSFNPPHRGHQALLDHVLRNAGDDLFLAAAIILPTDDDKLAAKNTKDEQPFLLTKAKRANLWHEAGLPKDRVWVFEGSEDSWKSFRARLQKNLARRCIDLRFVLLVGPDWISSRAASDPKSWDCVEALTSDVSRPVDFRYPYSLRQLPACSMWEPCSLQGDAPPSKVAIDAAAGKSLSPQHHQPATFLTARLFPRIQPEAKQSSYPLCRSSPLGSARR